MKIPLTRAATLAAPLALLLSIAACNQPSAVSAPARDTNASDLIRSNEAQWNQDIASRDLDKLVAHYADDAVLMAPRVAPAHGKQAIRTALQQMLLSDPNLSLKFQPSNIVVANSGDLAFSQGAYTMTLTDPQTKRTLNDHGSYVTAYRKEPDGSWKAVADIATSEVPPSPPATARHR